MESGNETSGQCTSLGSLYYTLRSLTGDSNLFGCDLPTRGIGANIYMLATYNANGQEMEV